MKLFYFIVCVIFILLFILVCVFLDSLKFYVLVEINKVFKESECILFFLSKGRSEMAKANKIEERDPEPSSSARKSLCNLFSKARDWTRDLILGPPTSLDDCLNVFFDKCDLLNENKYFCQTCNR